MHGKGRNIRKLHTAWKRTEHKKTLQNGILQFNSGFICQLRNILKIEFQKLN